MKLNLILVLLLALLVSGCAVQGVNTFRYTDNTPQKITNEIIVSKTPSEVWDILVKELSKSFYMINNIDKESRIINVSFTTDNPGDYVDCGDTHRTYTQGKKVETFDYEVANSSMFKLATDRQYQPAFAYYYKIYRTPELEGRSNIYVAPFENDESKTVITVNVRYVMTFKDQWTLYSEHANGSIRSIRNDSSPSSSMFFSTKAPKTTDFPDGVSITCFSKGRLEQEILDMIKVND